MVSTPSPLQKGEFLMSTARKSFAINDGIRCMVNAFTQRYPAFRQDEVCGILISVGVVSSIRRAVCRFEARSKQRGSHWRPISTSKPVGVPVRVISMPRGLAPTQGRSERFRSNHGLGRDSGVWIEVVLDTKTSEETP